MSVWRLLDILSGLFGVGFAMAFLGASFDWWVCPTVPQWVLASVFFSAGMYGFNREPIRP